MSLSWYLIRVIQFVCIWMFVSLRCIRSIHYFDLSRASASDKIYKQVANTSNEFQYEYYRTLYSFHGSFDVDK